MISQSHVEVNCPVCLGLRSIETEKGRMCCILCNQTGRFLMPRGNLRWLFEVSRYVRRIGVWVHPFGRNFNMENSDD